MKAIIYIAFAHSDSDMVSELRAETHRFAVNITGKFLCLAKS
jgi:hypothetical protein